MPSPEAAVTAIAARRPARPARRSRAGGRAASDRRNRRARRPGRAPRRASARRSPSPASAAARGRARPPRRRSAPGAGAPYPPRAVAAGRSPSRSWRARSPLRGWTSERSRRSSSAVRPALASGSRACALMPKTTGGRGAAGAFRSPSSHPASARHAASVAISRRTTIAYAFSVGRNGSAKASSAAVTLRGDYRPQVEIRRKTLTKAEFVDSIAGNFDSKKAAADAVEDRPRRDHQHARGGRGDQLHRLRQVQRRRARSAPGRQPPHWRADHDRRRPGAEVLRGAGLKSRVKGG